MKGWKTKKIQKEAVWFELSYFEDSMHGWKYEKSTSDFYEY